MKLLIKSEFIDKNTNEYYRVGDIKEFATSRANELLSDERNLVEKIVEESIEHAPKPKKTKK